MGGKWEKKREETVGRGARLADRVDPRALFACADAPGASQGAGFGMGPPALVSARGGEKEVSGGATGPFFQRRREKFAWGGLPGGAAGDALKLRGTSYP